MDVVMEDRKQKALRENEETCECVYVCVRIREKQRKGATKLQQ